MKVYCSKKGYFYKQYKNGKKVRISKDKYLKLKKSKIKQKGGRDYQIGNQRYFRLYTGRPTLGISNIASKYLTVRAEQEDYIYLVNDPSKKTYIKHIDFPNQRRRVTKIKKLVNEQTTQTALNNPVILDTLQTKGYELYQNFCLKNLDPTMLHHIWYKDRFYRSVKLNLDKTYINQNNFMEYKCCLLNTISGLPLIQGQHYILNKDFYKRNEIFFINKDSRGTPLFKFTEYKFKKYLNSYNSRSDMKPSYDSTMPYCFFLDNGNRYRMTFQYKLHISFNPDFTNDAFITLFKSEFYKKNIHAMKLFYPNWKHHYESTQEWEYWTQIKNNDKLKGMYMFYGGIGYVVIYLRSSDISNLKKFINYWKNAFENNPEKYRDENYIKFNERLSKTLYLGKGGDTDSKLENKITKSHRYSQPSKHLLDKYSPLIKSNSQRTKQKLKNTYAIDYNAEQLKNFEYWCHKRTPCHDILTDYDIETYEPNMNTQET